MPLVAFGAAAYALGLLLAQTAPPGAVPLLFVFAGAASVLALAGSRSSRAAVPILLAAGMLAGQAHTRTHASCARALGSVASLAVTVEADATPGAAVPATAHARGCDAYALLLIADGRANAGDAARVSGIVDSARRGVVIREARLANVRAQPSLAALRARAGSRLDRIFGADAPLARALVLADMSGIPAEQRDRFARAGLVHMLSVSGLHVAIIALALELLAGALRLPERPARVITLLMLAGYVIAIGAPPPAVRAATMLTLVLATRLLQRPTSTWAIVAVGSAVPLIQPEVVLDLGWQLSVAGTVALVAGGALAGRAVPSKWSGPRRSLARAAVVSIVATIVTAPLVAWTFGRIALLSPVTNLLADPLMGLLQPLLFIALCVPVRGVERICADAAHVLIVLFDGIASRAAAIPYAAPLVMPSVLAAVMGSLFAVAVVVACRAREPSRPMIAALCALLVIVAEPLVPRSARETEIHMIDVGQGDAIAIRTRRGRWVVVDAGRTWEGGDAGRTIVAPYLAHRGGAVSLFVMSHPHADHVGGAASLFAMLRPQRFLDPGYVGTSEPYRAALAAAWRDHIPWQRVHPGDSLVVDEVVLTELAPDSAWASALADANLASAVLVARIGAVRLLLTGDAEAPEEEWLLSHEASMLRADVLKVAHHGSNTSSTPRFLDAVRPRLALVSVGAHNAYGHPDAGVITALGRSGAMVLRTDLSGTIVVRTDGRKLSVEAHGARWNVPSRAADTATSATTATAASTATIPQVP